MKLIDFMLKTATGIGLAMVVIAFVILLVSMIGCASEDMRREMSNRAYERAHSEYITIEIDSNPYLDFARSYRGR